MLSSAANSQIKNIKIGEYRSAASVLSRTIAASAVGGLSSRFSGGKFENGAVTGAFVHLFNAEAKSFGKQNLLDHEGVNGSHTIERHVGKSDSYLLTKINESYGIGPFKIGLNEASTFSSLESANKLVSSVLSASQAEIEVFLQSEGNTLVINRFFGSATGRVVYRTGGNLFRPGRVSFGVGNSVRVVIRRNESFINGFNVHTAFPTRN